MVTREGSRTISLRFVSARKLHPRVGKNAQAWRPDQDRDWRLRDRGGMQLLPEHRHVTHQLRPGEVPDRVPEDPAGYDCDFGGRPAWNVQAPRRPDRAMPGTTDNERAVRPGPEPRDPRSVDKLDPPPSRRARGFPSQRCGHPASGLPESRRGSVPPFGGFS